MDYTQNQIDEQQDQKRPEKTANVYTYREKKNKWLSARVYFKSRVEQHMLDLMKKKR